MEELRDRMDVHAVNVLVPLEMGNSSRHMPLNQHTLGRMADQLANILDTLKMREVHLPPQALDTAQIREGWRAERPSRTRWGTTALLYIYSI